MTISDTVHGCGNSMEFYDMLIATLPLNACVCEVGVFYARGLVHLAQRPDLTIWGVDPFVRANMPYHPDGVETDEDFYNACRRNLDENGAGFVKLLVKPSVEAATHFPDGHFDCVFLDGDHSEGAVLADIAAWRAKVKPGGYLAGDDYIAPWGVIAAVDEAFPERLLTGQTWYVRL